MSKQDYFSGLHESETIQHDAPNTKIQAVQLSQVSKMPVCTKCAAAILVVSKHALQVPDVLLLALVLATGGAQIKLGCM